MVCVCSAYLEQVHMMRRRTCGGGVRRARQDGHLTHALPPLHLRQHAAVAAPRPLPRALPPPARPHLRRRQPPFSPQIFLLLVCRHVNSTFD